MSSFAAIDAHITGVEKQAHGDPNPELQPLLMNLKKIRNTLTPFCSVPDEIVSHILMALVLEPSPDPQSFLDIQTFQISSAWVSTMLVCYRLRSIAVATPELWSFIDCRLNPAWIRLCLQRAGDLPLTVSYLAFRYKYLSQTTELASLVLARAHQVAFRLSVPDPQESQISPNSSVNQRQCTCFECQQKKHPPENLGIALDHRYAKITKLSVSWSYAFSHSENFLVGASHNLTQLSLNMFIIGQTPVFPSLTHLRTHRVRALNGDYTHIYTLLGNAPLLEVLVKSDTIIPSGGDRSLSTDLISEALRRITFPHLRVLDINERASMTDILLHLLSGPSELLLINVEDKYGAPVLHLPLIQDTPKFGTFENILAQVQNLPISRTIATDLLPYCFSHRHRIRFGAPIDTTSPSPLIQLGMKCAIQSYDPLLAHIHTLTMTLDHDGPYYGDGEPPWMKLIALGGYLFNIRYIVIWWMESCPASRAFTACLRDRHAARCTLERLTLHARTSKTEWKVWASHLEKDGLVKSIVWA